MNNIKVKLIKKYQKYSDTKEAQRGLSLINFQIKKLNLKNNDVSLVYLGGKYFSEVKKFSMILAVVNMYSFSIKAFNIDFKVKVRQSTPTDVNLTINEADLGILNYKEGVPLQLDIPIDKLNENDFEVSSEDVEINIEKIRVRK